ncbi:MAG: hypothetical protein K0R78_2724 [Pelosinus sp.]|jgi:hypothetical protein|nr:hypothetical protein [Pelosinus sp.]
MSKLTIDLPNAAGVKMCYYSYYSMRMVLDSLLMRLYHCANQFLGHAISLV